MRGEPGFVLSGHVFDGSVHGQDVGGIYWSSTVSDASIAYRLDINSSDVNPSFRASKYYGISVRCIAKSD
jgi:hypothetical protein